MFADVVALYNKADVILKVKQPHFNDAVGEHEAQLLKPGSILVTRSCIRPPPLTTSW